MKLEEKMSSSGATDASGKSRAVQSASFRRGEVRIGGHGTRSESVAGGSNPDDDTNVPDAPEDSPDPLDAPDVSGLPRYLTYQYLDTYQHAQIYLLIGRWLSVMDIHHA